jgi:glycine/D-amino acid oxidase-like deaminating enzyme
VAYSLALKGQKNIHVFDPDLNGVLSSSERNAGGVRHLWQQPVNQELSKISISFYESIAEQIGFNQNGYLWLFSEDKKHFGENAYTTAKNNQLQYEKLSPSEIQKKYPFLDKLEGVSFGLLGNKDGILNSNSLKTYYRDEAKKRGVQFHDKSIVSNPSQKQDHTEFTVSKVNSEEAAHNYLESNSLMAQSTEHHSCKNLVLCCGAWIKLFPSQLNSPNIVKPIRRQMCSFKADDFDMSPYGMVVDTSGVYFHPEGKNILAGIVLKEEPAGFNFQYDNSFFENSIWPALYERSSYFEKLKHLTGWAGLYSYTPDITGILGKVSESIYEAHSFTGHGVMQSYAVGLLMSELVTEGKFQTLDAKVLSQSRFHSQSQWLTENLHI